MVNKEANIKNIAFGNCKKASNVFLFSNSLGTAIDSAIKYKIKFTINSAKMIGGWMK